MYLNLKLPYLNRPHPSSWHCRTPWWRTFPSRWQDLPACHTVSQFSWIGNIIWRLFDWTIVNTFESRGTWFNGYLKGREGNWGISTPVGVDIPQLQDLMDPKICVEVKFFTRGFLRAPSTSLMPLSARFCHSNSSHHHRRASFSFHHILHVFQK